MMVGNIKFQYASLWVQIWDALLDMIPPQVAKEVGNRIGLVEEVVERKQRQDDLSFFMRVRVAMPIVKPIRKGEFIAGSDGLRTWVKFKYERLSMFCHYCGVLGHDVKHCASHFAVVNKRWGNYISVWGFSACYGWSATPFAILKRRFKD